MYVCTQGFFNSLIIFIPNPKPSLFFSGCFLDYFPSPTRIMHEIQFQLLLHQQQQQQTSNPLPPDFQPQKPQPIQQNQPIVQQQNQSVTVSQQPINKPLVKSEQPGNSD